MDHDETAEGAREAAVRELLRRLAEQLDGVLEGGERELAGTFLAALGSDDAQEQAQTVHMALIHQLAMQRVAVAGRTDLALRPQQIELGLTIRMLTLYHRLSCNLDRRHAAQSRTARPAAARPEPPAAGYLVVPEPVSPEEWTRQAKAHHAGLGSAAAEGAAWQADARKAAAEARARGQPGGVVQVPWPARRKDGQPPGDEE